MTARLAFTGVSCQRGGRTLFEGLSFDLPAGAAAQVRGPNGIGKSSLIRIAAGLLRTATGTVRCEGACALLAERDGLDAERTVAAALLFWAAMDGLANPHGRVRHALTATDTAGLADVPVRMLSTGQRRRIGFARVLASGAAVWLLDEPANGLDAAAVTRIEALIADHRATGGIVLAATHIPLAMPGAVAIDLDTIGRGKAA